MASALGLDRLLIVPASLPPHKALPPGTPDAAHRMEMARLLATDAGGVMDPIEMEMEGPSYTYRTAEALRNRWPEAELWLLIGSDMLFSFHRWKEPGRILSACKLAAMGREDLKDGAMGKAAEFLMEAYGQTVRLIDAPPVVVSSTEVRQKLRMGRGGEDLPASVFRYIRAQKLYDFDERLYSLRKAVEGRLKASRYAHTLGCEEEAASLARRWGEDEKKAREAAILHDITKGLDRDEQLKLCEKFGIMTHSVAMTPTPVLHALTGAEVAAREFDAPDGVKDAIRWHTTGRADMSGLEKIVFLADMIEPGRRDFPGLADIRQAAYEDLDRALILAISRSIEYVNGQGGALAPDSERALRFLRENSGKMGEGRLSKRKERYEDIRQ